MLPPLSFLVPGVSKCGTTTLCSLLSEHPELFLPPSEKEPCLFNDPDYLSRTDSYRKLFRAARDDQHLGEGSTKYSVSEFAAMSRDRIARHFPDIRLIFIVRDPLDRLDSSFRQMHHRVQMYSLECPYSIGEALESMPSMLPDTRYHALISLFRERFSPDQIHVVFLEELRADPKAVIAGCFSFLGVDDSFTLPQANRQLNSGGHKYFDTPRMRELRNSIWSPETGEPLSRVKGDVQDQFLSKLGLRMPFRDRPIRWRREDLARVVEHLGEDVLALLKSQSRRPEIWPRFNSALNGEHPATETDVSASIV